MTNPRPRPAASPGSWLAGGTPVNGQVGAGAIDEPSAPPIRHTRPPTRQGPPSGGTPSLSSSPASTPADWEAEFHEGVR